MLSWEHVPELAKAHFSLVLWTQRLRFSDTYNCDNSNDNSKQGSNLVFFAQSTSTVISGRDNDDNSSSNSNNYNSNSINSSSSSNTTNNNNNNNNNNDNVIMMNMLFIMPRLVNALGIYTGLQMRAFLPYFTYCP